MLRDMSTVDKISSLLLAMSSECVYLTSLYEKYKRKAKSTRQTNKQTNKQRTYDRPALLLSVVRDFIDLVLYVLIVYHCKSNWRNFCVWNVECVFSTEILGFIGDCKGFLPRFVSYFRNCQL